MLKSQPLTLVFASVTVVVIWAVAQESGWIFAATTVLPVVVLIVGTALAKQYNRKRQEVDGL